MRRTGQVRGEVGERVGSWPRPSSPLWTPSHVTWSLGLCGLSPLGISYLPSPGALAPPLPAAPHPVLVVQEVSPWGLCDGQSHQESKALEEHELLPGHGGAPGH